MIQIALNRYQTTAHKRNENKGKIRKGKVRCLEDSVCNKGCCEAEKAQLEI